MGYKYKSKIGDIYKFMNLEDIEGHYYFQYVANDIHQLNSSVIIIFESFEKEMFILSEIVNQPILFYAHTVINWGVIGNHWIKIGNSQIIVDIKLNFKSFGTTYVGESELKK